MLHTLSIQDFVIVQHIELQFEAGFTTLTGETGAGKSILIDAVDLLLGGRADASLVRQGANKAQLQAEFIITHNPAAITWLQEQDLLDDAEPTCLIRRTLDQAGKSKCFINGQQTTAQQLRQLGAFLLDIHGQHAHQSLLQADAQRDLLDAFANAHHLTQAVKHAYHAWQAAEGAWRTWQTDAEKLEAEREMLAWKHQELETLNPQPDEWAQLQNEQQRLSHATDLLQAAEQGQEQLSQVDNAISSQLNSIINRLSPFAAIDAQLTPMIELLQSAEVQIEEASHSLRHYAQKLEIDPQALQEAEARMDALMSMARKYRILPEDLPKLHADTQARWQQLEAQSDGDGLRQQAETLKTVYEDAAATLSSARHTAATELGTAITAQMQTLAMNGSRFAVGLIPCDASSNGNETVQLQVAAHESMPLRPLNKVASGGELSRISLAIQVMTSQVAAVPSLIFDEVDVGIGGRVAEIVGKLLKQLGQSHQVLCITHLPQVAACADHQWQVSKQAQAEGVFSHIRPLARDERIDEIARMLGGVDITPITRQHAEQMLFG